MNSAREYLKELLQFRSTSISFESFIKKISKSDIENSIRRFGSGGLFGYLGLFKSDSLGNYTMYATDLSNLIFIRTNNKKYVFSCSCHKEVVEYVNIRLKQNCNVK